MLLSHWLYLISAALDLIDGARPTLEAVGKEPSTSDFTRASPKQTELWQASAVPWVVDDEGRVVGSSWHAGGSSLGTAGSSPTWEEDQADSASGPSDRSARGEAYTMAMRNVPSPMAMERKLHAACTPHKPIARSFASASGQHTEERTQGASSSPRSGATPRATLKPPNGSKPRSRAGRLSKDRCLGAEEIAAMCQSSESFKRRTSVASCEGEDPFAA